ncbi:hypothetical protein E4U30_007679 [Claviceps sp. LM220 group G6]|nr:hypothetical protein E4U30_007679 [Claviceps sp. LM220 group G6]
MQQQQIQGEILPGEMLPNEILPHEMLPHQRLQARHPLRGIRLLLQAEIEPIRQPQLNQLDSHQLHRKVAIITEEVE